MNNVTYVQQKVPSLYTALTTGSDARNPLVYGVNSNPYVIDYNSVVEIRLNNLDGGAHPFHLHGHQFQVVARPNDTPDAPVSYNGDSSKFPRVPMRRDTVQVMENNYLVLRYRANNPGVFLFHCHVEFHVEAGLTATMIEAPLQLQQQQQIPAGHLATCRADGIPTAGNAAGNTVNHLDLRDARTAPPPNPSGLAISPFCGSVKSVDITRLTEILGHWSVLHRTHTRESPLLLVGHFRAANCWMHPEAYYLYHRFAWVILHTAIEYLLEI